ncbi:uncharacterized protein LOC133370888 [Rhineura floridana]|uniref:uncharacterized protein LOC133370888 n=1 Tax=Rhineura floridana TaxID=261503 RepID=UPI002AC7E6D5|nr:uncharacterized protein LOC133370888 [Rhineura floridana]
MTRAGGRKRGRGASIPSLRIPEGYPEGARPLGSLLPPACRAAGKKLPELLVRAAAERAQLRQARHAGAGARGRARWLEVAAGSKEALLRPSLLGPGEEGRCWAKGVIQRPQGGPDLGSPVSLLAKRQGVLEPRSPGSSRRAPHDGTRRAGGGGAAFRRYCSAAAAAWEANRREPPQASRSPAAGGEFSCVSPAPALLARESCPRGYAVLPALTVGRAEGCVLDSAPPTPSLWGVFRASLLKVAEEDAPLDAGLWVRGRRVGSLTWCRGVLEGLFFLLLVLTGNDQWQRRGSIFSLTFRCSVFLKHQHSRWPGQH